MPFKLETFRFLHSTVDVNIHTVATNVLLQISIFVTSELNCREQAPMEMAAHHGTNQ